MRPHPPRQRIYLFRDLKPAGAVFTRKHITTLEKRGQFPMHFQLGENSVAWVASEVDAWVEAKIRSRRSAPKTVDEPGSPQPGAARAS